MNNEKFLTIGTLALSVAFSTGTLQHIENNRNNYAKPNNYVSIINNPQTYNNIIIVDASLLNQNNLNLENVISLPIQGKKNVILNGARKRTLTWF